MVLARLRNSRHVSRPLRLPKLPSLETPSTGTAPSEVLAERVAPKRSIGTREFIALLSATTALTALAIDTMLPAFSEIRVAFGFGPESTRVALIVTVFFIGMASGQFVYGPFSDRFGRKKALTLGLVIYCLGAIGTTVAPSFEILLVSRVVWGLGAAGPRVVSLAILRDRYSGDEMARVMLFVQAIFMIVPVLAPMWGRLWLELGDWRWTAGQAVVIAGLVALWSIRLPETLDQADRRAMGLGDIGAALREVASNRQTVGMAFSQTFLLGAFFPWLGSSELIVGDLYGHEDIYPFVFAGTGVAMAAATLTSSRVVKNIGAHRAVRLMLPMLAGLALVTFVVATLSDGLPPFWLFIVLIASLMGLETASTPQVAALALEPMGRLAGTASSAVGTLNFALGAFLGFLVDRQVNDTVTPIFVGFLIYGSLAAVSCWWALGGQRSEVS